jgi:plastocyanin
MRKNYYLIFALLILVVILVAGYLTFTVNKKQQSNISLTNKNSNQQPTASKPKATVILNNTGFSPKTLTVKTGTIVIWINQSGTGGSVNSDNHPTNLLFPSLNLGQFNNGTSVTTMFEKPGKYTYHNEVNPDQRGTVIVE